MPRTCRFHLATALLLAASAAGAASPEAPSPDRRMGAPPGLECPRDHLTVYAGKVLTMRRSRDRTVLRIHTDWATTETVTIAHPGSGDPAAAFLIEGRRFEAADWPRLESSPGHLRRGLRAAAWVCDDGRRPVVDWRPPR